MATISELAVKTTYEDVERLVHSIAWKFYKRFGGDLEELQAEARCFFADAYCSHDPKRSSFKGWLNYRTWVGLQKVRDKEAKKKQREHAEEHLEEIGLTDARSPWWFLDFLDELSDDAKTVARLVIDPPPDVIMLIRLSKEKQPRQAIRLSLIQFLRDCGWTHRAITESFKEIREALR